jgi:hypothetical protein
VIRFRFLLASCFSLSFLFASCVLADPTYTIHVFATGTAVSGTSPDSVTYGDGSLWIAYQNGADTAGASGSSTVVRYSPSGAVLNTWTIKGNVDGLNIDPTSGLVWALQNNDGNSALTVINPVTNATTPYTYGSTYTNVANRGFDDIVFTHGNVFISETNPASGTDAVIVKLTSGLHSPLQISPILNSTFTGTNLATGLPTSVTITDSDSLKLTNTGLLALTGEADQKIAFISNPGTVSQTETFLSLLGTNGLPITGNPDDTIFQMLPTDSFTSRTLAPIPFTALPPPDLPSARSTLMSAMNLASSTPPRESSLRFLPVSVRTAPPSSANPFLSPARSVSPWQAFSFSLSSPLLGRRSEPVRCAPASRQFASVPTVGLFRLHNSRRRW